MAPRSERVTPDIKKEMVDATRKRMQAAMMLLMMNTSELADEETFEELQAVPEAVKPYRDSVLSAVKGLDIALTNDSGTREALLQTVSEKREALLTEVRVLLVALESLETFGNRVQDAFAVRGLEQFAERTIQKQEFIKDCMDFAWHVMAGNEEGEQGTEAVTALIDCFPLCMARERFYAHIKETLLLLVSNSPEASARGMLNMLRYQLFPEETPGYNTLFPAFVNRVRELAAMDVSAMTEKALEELHNEQLELSEDIDFALEGFETLFESYQYLTLLLTFADDADNLMADDAVAKDVFCATVESLLTEEYEAFSEQLFNTLEEKLPDVLDAANKAFAHVGKQLASIKDMDEETTALAAVMNIVDEMFFASMRAATLNGGAFAGQMITEARADELADAFLDDFKTYAAPLPPKAQKALRKRLLIRLPFTLSPDDMREYLDAAFDAAPDFVQQALIVEKVGRVFENSGYNPQDKNLHEHGEDCDCGHHHHHGEDCDCGHHHHGEDCDCGHHHHR